MKDKKKVDAKRDEKHKEAEKQKVSAAEKIAELEAALTSRDAELLKVRAEAAKIKSAALDSVKENHARAQNAAKVAEEAIATAKQTVDNAKAGMAAARAKAEEMVQKMNEKHGALVKKLREQIERLETDCRVNSVAMGNMADRLKQYEEASADQKPTEVSAE